MVGTLNAGILGYTQAEVDSLLSTKPELAQGTHTVYVAKTGNDETGDGSATNPYLSIQRAIKHCGDAHINGGVFVISIGDGEYQERILIFGIHVTLQSTSGDKSKVIINGANDIGSYSIGVCGAIVSLNNLTIKGSPQQGQGVINFNSGAAGMISNCDIESTASGSSGVLTEGGSICFISACNFSNVYYCTYTRSGSLLTTNSCTATNCSVAFLVNMAVAICANDFTGVTTKYSVTSNGQLFG